MILKARPVALALSPYPQEHNPLYCQANENAAQLDNHKKMIEKNAAKMTQWQKSMAELSQQSAKGQIIHARTWELKQKELEELRLEKDHLELGYQRLQYKVKITGERLFSFFLDIFNDYYSCYIPTDEYRKYLGKYSELLYSSTNSILFTDEQLGKIQKELDKHLPIKETGK